MIPFLGALSTAALETAVTDALAAGATVIAAGLGVTGLLYAVRVAIRALKAATK